MIYRGFEIRERGRSFLAERPLPGEKAIYRIAGKTLKDLRELRLPRIGNVESFKTDFNKLLVAFDNVPAIDLTWMDSLTFLS